MTLRQRVRLIVAAFSLAMIAALGAPSGASADFCFLCVDSGWCAGSGPEARCLANCGAEFEPAWCDSHGDDCGAGEALLYCISAPQ